MSPKYMALIVFIWVTGSLMGAVIEGTYLGADQKSTLDKLLVWKELEIDQPWDVFGIPVAAAGFFSSMFKMMTFNFAFLEGNEYGQLFRWIIIAPFAAIFIYGVIMTVIGLFSRVLSPN